MKKIISAFLFAVMAVSVSVWAYADEAEYDCKNYSNFFDEKEYAEVIRDLMGDHIAEEAAILEADDAVDDVKATAYKVHTSYATRLFEKLSEGKSVSELVDDEYYWLIPGNNSFAYVEKREEDRWETTGSAFAPADADDTVNTAIESLDLTDQSEIVDIRCVYMPEYHSYFVFVTLSDKTYVIPYSTRPDFSGLENGALYSSAEAETILKQNYGDVYAEEDPNADLAALPAGGVGNVTRDMADEVTVTAISRKEVPLLTIVIVGALLIAGGITLAVLIWNKKSKYKQ